MFQSDMMAQDFKRTVARLQMDNDKLEKDLDNFAEKERQYLHQIKETEDRVSLSKSYRRCFNSQREFNCKPPAV